jgi:hypothetical protein
MRGLVIREPWIGKILAGEKTWEMRSKPTQIVGEIALVRQGAGLVVGTAKLTGSLPALTRQTYMDHHPQHAIPADMLDAVIENGWVYPWVLSDVRPLSRPVAYQHRPGAVTFVVMEEPVIAVIRRSAGIGDAQPPATHKPAAAVAQAQAQTPRHVGPAGRPAAATSSAERPVFEFKPQAAQAYGVPAGSRFVVRKGSTAMREGSPLVKRDRKLRDALVAEGVLVPDVDPRLFRFAADYEFDTSSRAAGVVKDGNASGPSLWKDRSGLSLKDYLDRMSRPL